MLFGLGVLCSGVWRVICCIRLGENMMGFFLGGIGCFRYCLICFLIVVVCCMLWVGLGWNVVFRELVKSFVWFLVW